MTAHRKKKLKQRNERHGAAWGGGRGLLLAIILVANLAHGQRFRPVSDEGGVSKNYPKMSADLAEMLKHNSGTMRVIVTYKNAPGSAQISKAQGRGARLNGNLSFVRAGAFTMSPVAIRKMANDNDVAFISPDRSLKAMDDLTDSAVGVSSAWNSGLDGTGIGVAVIDSGINDNHDDLQDVTSTVSRVVYRQDFTGTSTTNLSGAQWDLYGHGTHVAGIIGSNGAMSNGRFSGMAPNVNLIDLRVLDKNGAGSDSMVIAAIQRAIELRSTYNIRVINLSLGRGIATGYANDPLCQ